jgi:hypothetical protein
MNILRTTLVSLCLLSHLLAFAQQDSLTLKSKVAIEKAFAYLQKPTTKVEFADYAVYSYLQRRYDGLPTIKTANQVKMALLLDGNYHNDYAAFTRLTPDVNIQFSLKKVVEHYIGIDSFTVRALWADAFTIDKNYLNALEKFSKQGDYECTHAYLALIWLQENQHFIIKKSIYKKLFKRLESDVSKILKRRNGWYDIHSEALALFCYTPQKKYLNNDFINDILKHQTQNGGWLTDSQYKIENAHANVLTLWCLLEYTQPKPQYPKWIVK